MSIFDKFFTKFAYKFDKGYPDMNNDQDVLLLESLINEMPNPKEGEAYTDVVVETTKGDVNISAKGTSSPSIAGGGLKMASNLGPEVEEFIQDFYKDAYDYYKEIFDANPELTPDTNLYKTNSFKDVSRAVPQNIMKMF
jgi:hypothetical protein